jgi:YrbI family 3-deoxy-D-manno-octulosonate 8-phosphate phosphatase
METQGEKIRMFGMDVDGVLTDGGIYYGDSGLEIKRFNVQDGMGVTLLKRAGIIPFVITARTSEATARRAGELGITEAYQGIKDKLKCLRDLARRYDVDLSAIAFVGDDLSDLAVMKHVGCPIAVANAVEEVLRIARFTTSRGGGEGAVREACEHVLTLNGITGPWLDLLESPKESGEDRA